MALQCLSACLRACLCVARRQAARKQATRLFKAAGAAVLLLFLVAGVAAGEDSNPLGGLSPPIEPARLLIDGQVEDPPLYSGGQPLPVPRAGDTLEFQVFMPEVAGRKAFSYILEFDDTGNSFTDNFRIASVRTWEVIRVADASGRLSSIWKSVEQMAPLGSRGPGRSVCFLAPPLVPPNGLIATVALQARRDVPRDAPLRMIASVAVFSVTPLTRLWHFRGWAALPWR